MSKSKTSIAEHPWAWFAVFTVLAVGLMVLWWWWRLPSPPPPSRVLSDHGAFGDSFAPVIGLFSSLALGAAVLSVFIQREELRLQREEMRAMREEATQQREAAQELTRATQRANELAEERVSAELAAVRQARSHNILAARAQVLAIAQMAGQAEEHSKPLRQFIKFAAPDMVERAACEAIPAGGALEAFCLPLMDDVRHELRLLQADESLDTSMGIERLEKRAAELAEREREERQRAIDAKLAAMTEFDRE